jgi:hypothetical protein
VSFTPKNSFFQEKFPFPPKKTFANAGLSDIKQSTMRKYERLAMGMGQPH